MWIPVLTIAQRWFALKKRGMALGSCLQALGLLWASVVVFGAFYGATFPMYGACGGDYFRKEIMGRVIGAWTPFYGLGAIVGHRFAGYFRDVTGSFLIPFQVTVPVALIASILMLSVKRKA
jgi:MFS family permease